MQLLLVLAVDYVEMTLLVVFMSLRRMGRKSSGFSAMTARHVDYLLINLIAINNTWKRKAQSFISVVRSPSSPYRTEPKPHPGNFSSLKKQYFDFHTTKEYFIETNPREIAIRNVTFS